MGATSIYVNIFELVNIIYVQAINVDNGLSLLYLFLLAQRYLVTGNWYLMRIADCKLVN